MSLWKLVKLNFGRNLVHFGEVGIGLEKTSDRICSDSLFSAWVTTYARLFGKKAVEDLLKLFPTKEQPNLTPPFRISSTFIYREVRNNTIYYLPRPLKFPLNYPPNDLEPNDLDFFKTYKKLSYLPLQVWERWYQGEGFTEEDTNELKRYTLTGKPNGELVKTGIFDYKKACKNQQLPKVAIDRNTRATNLYHTGFVQFEWDTNPAGLYFILEIAPEGEKLADRLQAALHLLGEEGIGGERSAGAGKFLAKWLDLPKEWQKIIDFKGGKYQTIISLFWDYPIKKGYLENASYEIQERGGWIAESQIRRQMVRMFGEGSVFPTTTLGKLIDVTPQNFHKHRIYRSGISLNLPINVQESRQEK